MQQEFKYADLLDDDVFKLVFGQESSKDVMIMPFARFMLSTSWTSALMRTGTIRMSGQCIVYMKKRRIHF